MGRNSTKDVSNAMNVNNPFLHQNTTYMNKLSSVTPAMSKTKKCAMDVSNQ